MKLSDNTRGFGFFGGVELSSMLCNIAQKNLSRFLPQEKYKIYNADAGTWPYYDEYNYFYIYNSFPLKVMIEVLNRLNESLTNRPRKIHVLYLYPEHADVFEKDPHWRLISRGTNKELRNGMHVFIGSPNMKEEIVNAHLFKTS